MQKVLIISESLKWGDATRSVLGQKLPVEIAQAETRREAAVEVESRLFHLVILDYRQVDANVMRTLHWLQGMNYSFPILIISEKVAEPLLQKLSTLSNIYLLMKPAADVALVGLVKKLLLARRVPKQAHRRFKTNQIVQMDSLTSDRSLLTNMFNLSKGGAYCEFEGGGAVTVGDLYRMKINLSDTSREYTFNAKVVWTTPDGRFSGRIGCGLKFVSEEETQRSLLSRA